MEPERILPPEMLQPVEVRVVVAFGLGSELMPAGSVIRVARHRADYLKFLGLVDYETVL